MRLASIEDGGVARAGVVVSDDTFIAASQLVPGAPEDMLALIAADETLHARLRAAVARAREGAPLSSVRLLAPIPRPRRNVFCVGWNYSDHFAEGLAVRAQAGAPGQP